MIRIATILLLAAALTAPSQADQIVCYGSDSHFAVAAKTTDGRGMQVHFGERNSADAPIPCGADSADFVTLDTDESLDEFLGLFGNIAVLGAHVDPHTVLYVFNLPETKPIYSVWAVDPYATPEGISFFEATDIQATRENCPEYEAFTGGGLDAIIAELKFYDLATGEVQSLGERLCYQMI